IPGVEASTGSLGHGLSIGIGMAIGGLLDKKDYRTFVLLGDGECDEGSVWEAAMCASKHKLNKLTAIIDYNKMQCYGSIYEVQNLEPFVDKWKSFGWAVEEVDGHDMIALKSVFNKLPFDNEKPNVVICHTVRGKGIPFIENNPFWHHKRGVTDDEIKSLYEGLKQK
ncbi:MAG: thiamine pyrophosphate-dependent enzyme, partial [Elusimicrobiota bacterium]|nr:thiamine pyrophosphate-dependent enzyme [Elusimicrobiota bacterium]